MKNGTEPQKPSFKQLGTLAGVIMDHLVSILNFNQVQYWLSHKDELKKRLSNVFKIVEPVVSDPYQSQKSKISKFYLDCFGLTPDWSEIKIPANLKGLDRLELVLTSLTEDQIFEAYAKKFGKDKVWKYYGSITKTIKRNEGGEPLRPKSNYTLFHKGGIEPDQEHLNKSYNMFSSENNQYMIVKEGMIAAFRYRFETGEMYDIKGVTRFHSFDSDGNAMSMCRNYDGRWYMARRLRGHRDPEYGPRQVSF